jgi:hypothetical protein
MTLHLQFKSAELSLGEESVHRTLGSLRFITPQQRKTESYVELLLNGREIVVQIKTSLDIIRFVILLVKSNHGHHCSLLIDIQNNEQKVSPSNPVFSELRDGLRSESLNTFRSIKKLD